MNLTEKRLAEIERLEKAATEGPWEIEEGWCTVHQDYEEFGLGRVMSIARTHEAEKLRRERVIGTERESNAAFIAASRTAVPALIEFIKKALPVVESLMFTPCWGDSFLGMCKKPIDPCPPCISKALLKSWKEG